MSEFSGEKKDADGEPPKRVESVKKPERAESTKGAHSRCRNQLKLWQQTLPQCMLRDRYPLARRIQRFDCSKIRPELLQRLERDINASQQMLQQRRTGLPKPNYAEELPINAKRELIKSAIERNQVVIVAGETGSGKTTQIPKYCLELGRGTAALIGHTQPRRIAARTVAARIAAELNSEISHYVGFKVRFSDHVSESTYVKLMTDGILLAEIQNDRYLNSYDTIIIDEAHERSLNIDFLLGYLKLILPKRPDLKVIITSATIDTDRFSRFYHDAPVIEVSGRTYPVDVLYRPLVSLDAEKEPQEKDQYQGILDAVDELSSTYGSGHTLVFLSGEREIRDAAEALRKHHPAHTEILPLYSRLSVSEQNRVFQPGSRHRIVLATNVAETSLTVPGIKYVVDPGYARISRYSYRSKVQRLPVERISQSSANQRKGRCGRVMDGVCIRLYSEEDFAQRPEFTEPEIRRTNLAAVILQMENLKLGKVDEFPFIEGPDGRFINDGYKLLWELQAVDAARTITELGRKLVQLPIDPKLGRVLLAAKFEQCLREVLIIVSALSCQDPRDRPAEKQNAADQAHERFYDPASDFLFYTNVWQELQEQKQHLSNNKFRKFCQQHYLSYLRVKEWQDLHRQLKQNVTQMGWRLNQEPGNYAQIHRAILSGFLGSVGMKSETYAYSGQRNITFYVHPASALSRKTPKWLMAAEIVETSKLYARNVAKIEPQWLESVGGHLLKKTHSDIHWEKNSGHVVALESATLYGLPIYSAKRINYSAIDAHTCRELFIRHALVQGDWNAKFDFIQHNTALMDEIEQEEAKIRRRDILVDKAVLESFFAERIPEFVNNASNFKKWYKQSSAAKNQSLFYTRQLLIQENSIFAQQDQFPKTLQINAQVKLELQYCFSPGDENDGVTALIPAPVLDQLNPVPFEWLVPGLIKDKVVHLIKGLPKSLRKSFVPAPQFADACLQGKVNAGEPLLSYLSRELLRMTAIKIEQGDWQAEKLPQQYLMNFQVLDRQGRELARGRDLSQIKSRLSDHTQAIIDTVDQSAKEPEQVVTWDFGDLPKETCLQVQGNDVSVYPALVDRADSVIIKNFSDASQANEQHPQGVYRLYLLENRSSMKYLSRNIPRLSQLCMQYATLDSCEALRSDICQAIVKHLLFEDGKDIRTKEQFRRQSHFTNEGLQAGANELATVLQQALDAHQQIRTRLDSIKAPQPSVEDMSDQLDWLIYTGFVVETPYRWLLQLPRFLQGLTLRLGKLQQNPDHDGQRLETFLPYWHDFVELYNQQYEQGGVSSALMEYRWVLEEMRVSVFAQPLKTSMPVSYKRLERMWQVICA
ncbi:MAG: ATP-dependent RNA helicase HrpA [Gammaproteobacteria bacterium]|nr:ATP-dependent RNA helicase HrpA [Gammaproteobacteria bacterium]MDH5802405.1 ATP-dependent RNA helicase HrpA [Gammaproteobacteria bacterium]